MIELFYMLLAFSSLPDLVNGCFELVGGLLSIANIRAIMKDKKVRGMALTPLAFFTAWGYWNVLYYPYLLQWFSFLGGLVVIAVNTVWLVLAIYYTHRERLTKTSS